MNGNDFPLSPFLAALAADGISLTLRDYARIHLALQTDGAWTISRLRDTLLGLLARDVDQQELFLRRFHDFFALELAVEDTIAEIDVRQVLADLQQLTVDQPVADPPKTRPPQRSSLIPPRLRKPPKLNFGFWTLWSTLLVVGLITVGYFLLPLFWNPPPSEALPVPTVQSETPAIPAAPDSLPRTRLYTDVPYIAEIRYEPLATLAVWQRNAAVAAFFLFATLLYGLYLWRSRKIPEDKAPAYNPAGPRHFALGSIGGPPAPRLDDVTLNELADSMGYFQSGERGRRLDVTASIQLTMHRGGVPALEFHKRQQLRSLLILEDAFAEPLAWNPLAGELAAGMARLGVPVLYGRFHGSPAQFKTQDNAVHRLEDLEDQRNGFLLLVFTDGKSLQRQESVFALEGLARWPMVAWMELSEPRLWDENTALPRDYAIPLYPATPAGTLNAVRRFLTEQGAIADGGMNGRNWRAIPQQVDVRLDAHVEQLLGDALLWAQVCAMLQPVSPGLADALRRAFYPALPAERIERLYALPGTLHNVSGLRFAADVLRVLRTGFLVRRSEAEQEQVLRFLVDQIEKAEPAEGDSPAHLAWEAVKERVHLELDQDAALVRLAQLAKTPVGAAISASLDNFGFREDTDKIPLRLKPKNRHAWQRLARIADGFNIPKLEAYPVGWRHRLALGLLAMAMVGFIGLSIASYLRPPLPTQNWKVVGVGEAYARLAFKVETAEEWNTEHSGELHNMTALPLHPEREYQLVLFGGGAKTVNLMPVKNHQMTVIALATKTQEVDCRTEFVDIGLIVERCADVDNVAVGPVQQSTWRGKLGDAAPGSRLMSIGLEIAGQGYSNPPLNHLRNILLESSSVDVIYRIQPDSYGKWHIDEVFNKYMLEDLGPQLEQSQLIWWVVGKPPNVYDLDNLFPKFGSILKLGRENDLSWIAQLETLLQSTGADFITEREILGAFSQDLRKSTGSVALIPLQLSSAFSTIITNSGIPISQTTIFSSSVTTTQVLTDVILSPDSRLVQSPFVYRLQIGGCAQPPLERTQTGFRVKDQALVGIVTALHGIAGCKTINAMSDSESALLLDFTVTQVDIARDVALLGSKQLDALALDGLAPELETTESSYEGLQIIGYHSGIARQATSEAITLREITDLVNLVPDPLLRALVERRSPALDIHVLNINGNLLPGHSGAPILNGDGRVIGVVNGGIDLGRVGWGWAIPWQEIDWKTVAPAGSAEISEEDIKRLDELAKSNPQLFFSFSTPVVTTATPSPTRTPINVKTVIIVQGAGAARMIDLIAPANIDQ